MAIYGTSFNEYTLGVQPADWTDRWVTTNWTKNVVAGTDGDGPRLRIDSTLDGRHLLTWDDVDADADRADSEILARISTATTSADNLYFGLTVRASGSATTETGYTCYLYDGNYYLIRYDAGASNLISSVADAPQVALGENWHWMRLRINGTSIKARAWRDYTDEPTTWPLDVTDANLAAAGSVGLMVSEANTPDLYVDYIGIGTNGDTVPLPVDATANIRADQQLIQVAAAPGSVVIHADQQFIQVAETPGSVVIRADQQFIQVAHEYVPPVTEMETDFSEYTTGAPPTGWTERWDTASVTWDIAESALYDGGKYLTQSVHSADARTLFSWDALDNHTDIELLYRIRTNDLFSYFASYFTYLQVRASGASGTETSYMAILYYNSFDMQLHIGKYVSGTYTSLGTYIIDDLALWGWKKSTHYLVRLSVVGTAIKAKVWPDGTPEPGWLVEATDASIASGTWAGIGEFYNTEEIYYGFISAGLEGESAPLETNAETSGHVSQVLAEIAVAGTAGRTNVSQVLAEVAVVSPYAEPPVVGASDFVVVSINT